MRSRIVGDIGTFVQLGPRYEEEFRAYLAEETLFLANSALLVCLSAAPTPHNGFSYPIVAHHQIGCHANRFVIPGICLDVFVGKAATRAHGLSLSHSAERFVHVTNRIEDWIANSSYNLSKASKAPRTRSR